VTKTISSKSLWIDNKTPEDIEYFLKEDSENVVYNLQEDILCLKDKIAELEAIVKAVAHIGVDFGYGKYDLEAGIIDDARTLMEQE
jgi:hypothetical protein